MKKTTFSTLFWLLSCTWGIVLTVVGALVVAVLATVQSIARVIFKKDLGIRVHKNACTVIVEVGGNWGGLELGPFALCGGYNRVGSAYFEEVRRHEFGHSIQHCFLGIFFIFIVQIPSACRYWYQRIAVKQGKTFPKDWYDSIWFEGGATKWGTKAVNWFESTPMSAGSYIKARILSVVSSPEQYIRIKLLESQTVCNAYVYNKERDWEFLAKSVGEVIQIKLNIMAANNVLIMDIQH